MYLGEGHSGDDGQHDLLPLGGVGVLLVLQQPGLQGAGGLPGGVLTARRSVAAGIPGDRPSTHQSRESGHGVGMTADPAGLKWRCWNCVSYPYLSSGYCPKLYS